MRNEEISFLICSLCNFRSGSQSGGCDVQGFCSGSCCYGRNFQIVVHTVNAEGRDIRVPEIPDFEVLIGPSTSTNMSTQIINGKMTTETSLTFTYILQPKKEVLSISHRQQSGQRRQYTSNALVIKCFLPDKAEEATKGGSTGTGISKDDAFLDNRCF